jgi:excisionase family DNA binding protein
MQSIAHVEDHRRMVSHQMCRPEIRGTHATDAVWLTTNDAADYLKVKPRTLQLWVRQKKVPGYALSKARRLNRLCGIATPCA